MATAGMTAPECAHKSAGTGPRTTRSTGPCADDARPATLAQLFRDQAINDGAGMIKLELPPMIEAGVRTLVSIEVNWSLVLTNAVACLYLVADLNAVPLLAKIALPPDIIPPHLALEVRLEAATHVRAVVQCGNGALLQVKRWVWVMPASGAPDPALARHWSVADRRRESFCELATAR